MTFCKGTSFDLRKQHRTLPPMDLLTQRHHDLCRMVEACLLTSTEAPKPTDLPVVPCDLTFHLCHLAFKSCEDCGVHVKRVLDAAGGLQVHAALDRTPVAVDAAGDYTRVNKFRVVALVMTTVALPRTGNGHPDGQVVDNVLMDMRVLLLMVGAVTYKLTLLGHMMLTLSLMTIGLMEYAIMILGLAVFLLLLVMSLTLDEYLLVFPSLAA
ncbi:hypothetical protein BDK51DRAFT_49588 [Blyttiomyces helicus]|uniref:Uncharacterized protein n=1 Tax=Blyttiomyces helicus TaxID=388810 RepID=A0A4P9WDQ2_9FUNG|nr:hypothetical protein BDK51DRAFT_49588 [Blyttiomyces helicus]|eukprot:RKO90831.1 hypothetical protein BDK51DRAFT_49588 [Blyttiomyces helicus]